jgi:predicted AAA+ superfamily ATPase
MYDRLIKLPKSNSFFVFGARGTGKSTLLKERLNLRRELHIDLLNPEQEGRLQAHPMGLTELLDLEYQGKSTQEWVMIDEIQKVPVLLDVVHSEIEKGRFLFALTGSSARKLKRGSANLLAGRAFTYSLFPLTHLELGADFNLDSVLSWGSLPKIFQIKEDEEKADFLRTYAQTYLKEEILAEQLIRKVAPFRAFLEVAAQSSGKIINYSKIARDVASDPVSIQSYFEILEDTLIGYQLKPFDRSLRKRQRKNPKFYLFDCGVERALGRNLTVPITPQTYGYGNKFEQFLITEIARLNSYFKKDWELSYLRTKDDAEIDLIIDRPGLPYALVEIKSTRQIDETHLGTLVAFSKDLEKSEAFCLSQDPIPRKIRGVNCLPWQRGLVELGLGLSG